MRRGRDVAWVCAAPVDFFYNFVFFLGAGAAGVVGAARFVVFFLSAGATRLGPAPPPAPAPTPAPATTRFGPAPAPAAPAGGGR
jgi:uncharacterized membrane protein YedE/YeeE